MSERHDLYSVIQYRPVLPLLLHMSLRISVRRLMRGHCCAACKKALDVVTRTDDRVSETELRQLGRDAVSDPRLCMRMLPFIYLGCFSSM